MGTRGFTGFRIGGVNKIAYQQFDSYPDGVGAEVVTQLRSMIQAVGVDGIRKLATDLKKAEGKPTEEQIIALQKAGYVDLQVSTQKTDDWYCLLRKTQGSPYDILQAGIFEDSEYFAADSLFCEHGYLINLDDEKLEYFVGFQKAAHTQGRFCNMVKPSENRIADDYHPVALKLEIPFADIVREGGKGEGEKEIIGELVERMDKAAGRDEEEEAAA